MAAIVKVWVGELTKLREKVLTSNLFLSKAKQGTDQNNKESISVPPRDTSSSTMSEATVCLLMDRFVPW
ncbi:hypothetical protein P8452_32406 [Trifolium repens]|jgi:hypothetical protein|nr:hypothetical protein P8452_32406 [Trifolium repens]